jgi:hypothetical protein
MAFSSILAPLKRSDSDLILLFLRVVESSNKKNAFEALHYFKAVTEDRDIRIIEEEKLNGKVTTEEQNIRAKVKKLTFELIERDKEIQIYWK